MKRARRLALLLLLLLLLAGCNVLFAYEPAGVDAARPQETGVDQLVDYGQPVDTTAPDQRPDASPDLPQGCSPSGLASGCDPYEPTSCTEGFCYLLKQNTSVAPACVCPEGTTESKSDCWSTVNCRPGFVCANIGSPGSCRPLCTEENAWQVCDDDQQCVPIIANPDYGYCASCSEQGRPWDCNPIANTGCLEGTCYLVATAEGNLQPMCICPQVGTKYTGEACTETVQCLPGLVCVEIYGQAKCRDICQYDSQCSFNETCRRYRFQTYGYCLLQW